MADVAPAAHDDTPVGRAFASLDPLRVRIETHQRYSVGANRLEEDVREALALTGSEAVLDIGCGTGRHVAGLRASGHDGLLVGLDASRAAVIAGRELVPNADWVLGDACALPFGGSSFDRVTARHMLYHVPDVPRALAEACRVLRPGGRFLATVNIAGPYQRCRALVFDAFAAQGVAVDGTVLDQQINADRLPPLVEAAFGNVTTTIANGELVFHEPEPLIAYTVAMLPIFGATGELVPPIAAWIEQEAPRRLADLGGEWRDAKGYAVIVADVG